MGEFIFLTPSSDFDGFWNPDTQPTKLQSGRATSPNVFILLADMSFTLDDVAQAKKGTIIYFDSVTKRWKLASNSVKDRGVVANQTALAQIPNPSFGDYVFVSSTQTVWYYNGTSWLNSGYATPPNGLTTADVINTLISSVIDKPLSAAMGKQLQDTKVDKVAGKQLSTEDYTTFEKNKLATIETGAEVNVQVDWAETSVSSDAFIKNKPNVYTVDQTYNRTEIDNKDALRIPLTQKGMANGVATLDGDGKVPASQLNPSGVSTYASFSNFPPTGLTNNVYYDVSTTIGYIWKDGAYAQSIDATTIRQSDVVNNLSGTSTNKPLSAAMGTELQTTKVDKISGKGLSSEDYTTAEKTKLAGIASGAEVNVQANWTETDNTSDSFINNKPSIYNQTQVDSLLATKIDKVLSQDGKIPLFNASGNLTSSNLTPANFEPADATIIKQANIANNLTTNNPLLVLSAAMGVSIKSLLDGKEPTITAGSASQYWSGTKEWKTLNQNAVGISNNLITNVSQEVILSSLATPSDIGTQSAVKIRVGNTTTTSTQGANLELQAGNGTNGSGKVVFSGAATPADSINIGTNSGGLASSVTALTFSNTVPSGSDRCLVVQVVCSGGQQSSSATFASAPMTLAERTQSTSLTIETYYLVAPSVATGVVQINFSNPVNNVVARAINLTGVDQTSPLGQKTKAFNNNQVTSASLTVATTIGQIVIDLIGTYNVTATSSGGQIQIWSGSTAQQEKGQTSYEIAQEPSTNVSYTFASASYAMHVMAFNKVGGTNLGSIIPFAEANPQGLKASSIILPYERYSTGGTFTLLQTSASRHKFYTSGQSYVIKLPKAIYLQLGTTYEFENRGATAVTIQTDSGSVITTVPVNYRVYLDLLTNVTYDGTWEVGYQASDGSVAAYVTTQKGVANGVAPLNASGIVDSQYLPASQVPFQIGDYKTSVKDADHSQWLLCDGRSVSRTTYASLFALIGTSFGGGDGSTTFHLPDPRGRALAMIGAGAGLTNRLLGTSLGTETHTLSVSELPAHNHRVRVNTNNDLNTLGGYIAGTGETGLLGATDRTGSYSNAFKGLQTGTNQFMEPTGQNQPHNLMQPTLFIGNLFIFAGV
jgi:microcystin-dependent protein